MKLFVWDLHGTLEQGNEEAVIELSNMALAQLGYAQRFQLETARDLYGLKWYEYYEQLLPEEPHERHMELQVLSFQLSDANPQLIARYMRPSPHAHAVLEAIHNSSDRQVLLSNTIPTAVPMFVHVLGMEKYFTAANSFSINAHSKEAERTKEDALKDHLLEQPAEKLIVIGDSATDVRLAKAMKAAMYLYAHPGYPFRVDGGDYRIHDLRKVLRELD